jgi:hypothetical protein
MRKQFINWLMPGYYEHVPELEEGLWRAGTCMTVPEFGFPAHAKKYKPVFADNQKAYKYARFRAWLRDLITRGSDWGVNWEVHKESPV